MKNHLLPVLFLAASVSYAGVPSEINYQGRLTDANGDAVTGDVSISLKMFDAATGGNELYSEDIGTVTLDDNGVYSFQFGAGGASVVATDESVATTDGSSQVFNATLSELPIDGSVSISDGTYTWSQASGSSNPSEFTGSVTISTGAISAIYLSGAPSSGTEITASYNYSDSGIGGALSSHNAHWLELSMDGTAQSPRERVLSVPFAQVAGFAGPSLKSKRYPCSAGWYYKNDVQDNQINFDLPLSLEFRQDFARFDLKFDHSVKSITDIQATLQAGVSQSITLSLQAKNSRTLEVSTLESFSLPPNSNRTEQDFSLINAIILDTENFNYYFIAGVGSSDVTNPARLVRLNLELMVED